MTVYDPVAACDIADRLGVTRSTVSNWQTRYTDFPRPVFTVAHGTRIWDWADVVAWAQPRMMNSIGVFGSPFDTERRTYDIPSSARQVLNEVVAELWRTAENMPNPRTSDHAADITRRLETLWGNGNA